MDNYLTFSKKSLKLYDLKQNLKRIIENNIKRNMKERKVYSLFPLPRAITIGNQIIYIAHKKHEKNYKAPNKYLVGCPL
jgi:IS30 family transposase